MLHKIQILNGLGISVCVCVSNQKWCGLLGKPTSTLILILFDQLHVPEPCAKEQEKLLESRLAFLSVARLPKCHSGPSLGDPATSKLLIFRVATEEPFALLDLEYRDGMDSHVT